jgi:hypothetical protein
MRLHILPRILLILMTITLPITAALPKRAPFYYLLAADQLAEVPKYL